mmetsp:Transcript_14411/g.47332  ORF Transcript_14411/g.47332 Transcript_14411/m.47332 type:complete len:149 (-) Transcript_14411:683-1129(-)
MDTPAPKMFVGMLKSERCRALPVPVKPATFALAPLERITHVWLQGVIVRTAGEGGSQEGGSSTRFALDDGTGTIELDVAALRKRGPAELARLKTGESVLCVGTLQHGPTLDPNQRFVKVHKITATPADGNKDATWWLEVAELWREVLR